MSEIHGTFLKCVIEKGWRRSVGPIEWKMMNFRKSQVGDEYRKYNKKEQD